MKNQFKINKESILELIEFKDNINEYIDELDSNINYLNRFNNNDDERFRDDFYKESFFEFDIDQINELYLYESKSIKNDLNQLIYLISLFSSLNNEINKFRILFLSDQISYLEKSDHLKINDHIENLEELDNDIISYSIFISNELNREINKFQMILNNLSINQYKEELEKELEKDYFRNDKIKNIKRYYSELDEISISQLENYFYENNIIRYYSLNNNKFYSDKDIYQINNLKSELKKIRDNQYKR